MRLHWAHAECYPEICCCADENSEHVTVIGGCCLQENGSEAKQIKVNSFPVGSRLLNELMSKLMAVVKLKPILRNKLYQTNFHTTLSGEAVVTMIYHKKLDAEWNEAAEALREELGR